MNNLTMKKDQVHLQIVYTSTVFESSVSMAMGDWPIGEAIGGSGVLSHLSQIYLLYLISNHDQSHNIIVLLESL